MQENSAHVIPGYSGVCGHLPVFIGFAPARVLFAHSFADVLDDDTGLGYQRPRNLRHSKSFRAYIGKPGTSTIPLTFNIRGRPGTDWEITEGSSEQHLSALKLAAGSAPLAQVDCQHRLGELGDSDVPLAFMAFIGLDLRAEMALFNIINTRAKGLTSSLTDYHESNLVESLADDAPHLFIARNLNEDAESPWYRLIKYGGETSSGLKRRVSLRMMQCSTRKFLRDTCNVDLGSIRRRYDLIKSYWLAIRELFREEWDDPRRHLLMKGVGLYSLSYLLADIVKEHPAPTTLSVGEFKQILKPLREKVDWSSKGPFATAGGQKGAVAVYHKLKEVMNI